MPRALALLGLTVAINGLVAHAVTTCGAGLATDASRFECQMGWATQCPSGPVTGGEGATVAHTYTVSTRAQLISALADTSTKIIYVTGTIRGDDLGNGTYADAAYYRKHPTPVEFYHNLYLQSFNKTFMAAVNKTNATLYALALKQASLLETFQENQQAQILVDVTSNTSLIGIGDTALIQGVWMRIKAASNVIIRNIEFEAPRDLATAWDSSDGFNAEYDAITIEKSTCLWIDHLTLSDGRYPDDEAGTFMGEVIQYHDGLLDMKSASDYITISRCVLANHDKTSLIGSSDSATGDMGHLRITFFANFFNNTIQRTPRARFGQIHILNNYYKAGSETKYFIGMGYNSSIYSEGNYFEASSSDLLVSYLKGTVFRDSNSCLNGVNCTDEIQKVAKAAVGSKYSSTLGWAPPYSYSTASCSLVKSEVISNAGAGKLDVSSSAAAVVVESSVVTPVAGVSSSEAVVVAETSSSPTAVESSVTVVVQSSEEVISQIIDGSSSAATVDQSSAEPTVDSTGAGVRVTACLTVAVYALATLFLSL